jgi:type II secretory pathway component PulC
MFLGKKAQSTAEYALVLGLVIAVVAGGLQVALKGGIRQKNKQALNYLLDAGSDQLTTGDQAEALFSQESRKTTVLANAFVDEAIMEKGGKEKKYQKQSTQSESTSVELIDEATQ